VALPYNHRNRPCPLCHSRRCRSEPQATRTSALLPSVLQYSRGALGGSSFSCDPLASSATSAPASRPTSRASSAPTTWRAAPGAGSATSGPTSGPWWSPTTSPCWPPRADLTSPLPALRPHRHAPADHPARGAPFKPARRRPRHQVGNTPAQPTIRWIPHAVHPENNGLWTGTSLAAPPDAQRRSSHDDP
jgi:hypothetical protein